MNTYLQERRVRLIGNAQFIPKSYLHLAHHWNILSDEEFHKGVEYGMVRGLALKSQDRKVVWTHKTELELCTSWALNEREMQAIERLWRNILRLLTLEDIDTMDWLVHDALNYDMLRSYLTKKMGRAQEILARL